MKGTADDPCLAQSAGNMLHKQQANICGQVAPGQQYTPELRIEPVALRKAEEHIPLHRNVDPPQQEQLRVADVAPDQRTGQPLADMGALREREEQWKWGVRHQRQKVCIEQRWRVLGYCASDDRAVPQEREDDGPWRLRGVKQAIGEGCSHLDRRVVQKSDQDRV